MAVSLQTNSDTANEFATIQFVIQSILARIATATLVKVISCTRGGSLAAWGTVTVQPLISQLTGDNVAVQHGTLFELPYLRMQGGLNAVILDPQPGDIGMAAFCARDINSLKAQETIDQIKAGAVIGVPPASGRQYSMADGIYFGGMLNAAPTQYIRFGTDQIEVVSPTKIVFRAPQVEIDASSSLNVTSPSTALSGHLDVTGYVKGQGTDLHTHEHSGVQPGGGTSGPPV